MSRVWAWFLFLHYICVCFKFLWLLFNYSYLNTLWTPISVIYCSGFWKFLLISVSVKSSWHLLGCGLRNGTTKIKLVLWKQSYVRTSTLNLILQPELICRHTECLSKHGFMSGWLIKICFLFDLFRHFFWLSYTYLKHVSVLSISIPYY